jgi:glycosyltransferase involved in cell wall biosynthesis
VVPVSNAPLFTVFTPTYNRAHTLHRVYDSLRAQTLRDFEWLVVDDGSTDDTPSLIAQWTKAADFPVRHFKQEHSGKHIAHNLAVCQAQGEFFITLDSDDACVPHTLQRMAGLWQAIPVHERQSFCGVGGLCVDQHGKLVGGRFPREPLDADMHERHYIYRIKGEKCVMMRTELVRRFPFPEIKKTSFVPEGRVWFEVAKTRKIRWVNETFRIYYINGRSDGSTLTSRSNLHESAAGRMDYYVWLLNNNLKYFFHSPKPFLTASVMLPLVARLSNCSITSTVMSLENRLARALMLVVLPIGFALYVIDRARWVFRSVCSQHI